MDILRLYDNVTYKYDTQNRVLVIKWNKGNKNINSLMNEEITPYNYPNSKYNCFWVGELKKCISWKIGVKIHINIQSAFDGTIHICVCDYQENRFIYEEIGEDGYLYINPYQYIFEKTLEKCNCVYNDLLEEEINLSKNT
jgi:hypothetical protein